MKCFVIVLLCFVAVNSAKKIPENGPLSVYTEVLKLQNELTKASNLRNEIYVVINEYLDNAISIIQSWSIQKGLDPLETKNLEEGFSVNLGLVTFHGEFTLTHGWMQGISGIERGGDASMAYENKSLTLRLPLVFPAILINYDYKAKIMNLGPKGGVEGKIKNLQILVDISINTTTLEITLNGFRIIDAGKIDVDFSGNALVDWLLNALTGVANTLLHDVVVGVVQNQVREILKNTIDQINEGIHPTENYYLH